MEHLEAPYLCGLGCLPKFMKSPPYSLHICYHKLFTATTYHQAAEV